MLPRLVSNSWAQMILPLQLCNMLGLQASMSHHSWPITELFSDNVPFRQLIPYCLGESWIPGLLVEHSNLVDLLAVHPPELPISLHF